MTATAVDTRDMLAANNMYRRELALIPNLVRSVAEKDTRRATVLRDHLEFIDRGLRHKNATADDLLYPRATGRLDSDGELFVELSKAQHELAETIIVRIEALRAHWVRTADAKTGAELAALYEELHSTVLENFEFEEAVLLPIMARVFTEKEWKGMAVDGGKRAKKSDIVLMFGAVTYGCDHETMEAMLQYVPGLLRGTISKAGRNTYAKHAQKIHGTATP